MVVMLPIFEEQAAQDAFEIDDHELSAEQREIWAQIRGKKGIAHTGT
jgi:nucleolar GTP-binding protein